MADDAAKEAVEYLKDATDRESDQRKRMLEDIRFRALDQWPTEIKRARETAGQPCLTIDKSNQYINQVINDIRQARPSIKVRPVDSDGDAEVAEVFDGLIRDIQDRSKASVAYDTAVDAAVTCGLGYFRILTEYEEGESFDQYPCIKRVPSPFSVYPSAYTEPDGCDMTWCLVTEDITHAQYKAKYKGNPKALALDAGLGDDVGAWATRDIVKIAEVWKVVETPTRIVALSDGRIVREKDMEAAMAQYQMLAQMATAQGFPVPPMPTVVNEREASIRSITWCKVNGREVIEESDWLGTWIPVLPVHGVEQWVDGKRILSGLIRPLADAGRMYNYWASAMTERVALQPKTPFVGPAEAFAGHENLWKHSNKDARAYLPYNHRDDSGEAIPAPQRTQPAPIEPGMSMLLERFERDMQTAVGMFKASLGQESNEKSGRAILARQREGDTGTFHYPDNLSRSIQHAGRILVELIPKLYDVRRVLRILGEDGQPHEAEHDPEQVMPVQKVRDEAGEVRKIYNLGVGRYDVTVTTGPSYNTQRMESAAAMTELIQANPALFGVFGDLYVKSQDWPMADDIAKRVRATIPPNILQEDDAEDGGEMSPAVAAKMRQVAQTEQMIAAQTQALEQAAQKVAADQATAEQTKAAADAAIKTLNAERQVMAADYKRMVAEINLKTATGTQQAEQSAVAVLTEFSQRQEALIQSIIQRQAEVERVVVEKDGNEKAEAQQLVAAVASQLQGVQQSVAQVAAMVDGSQPAEVIVLTGKDGRPVGAVRRNKDGSEMRFDLPQSQGGAQ